MRFWVKKLNGQLKTVLGAIKAYKRAIYNNLILNIECQKKIVFIQ